MASTDSEAPVERTKPTLTGVAATMLVTLASRADDAASSAPILGDHYATATLAKLDTAFSGVASLVDPSLRKKLGHQGFLLSVLTRARLLDVWATEYLTCIGEDTPVTVLHLGCGLDSRALRLASACGRRAVWFDVDVPDVVALRRNVIAEPEGGEYSLVGADVTRDDWLDAIPADRPTLVIMEGLLMYLGPVEGPRLIQRLTQRFSKGHLVFDTAGWLLLRIQRLNEPIAQTGALMSYAIDEASEVEELDPRLKAKTVTRQWELATDKKVWPLVFRFILWIHSLFPGTRTMGSYMRFDF